MTNVRCRGQAEVIIFLLILVVGVVLYENQQWFRVAGTQPPIGASVRNSYIGAGRVLILTNQGKTALVNVTVEAANSAKNTHASYHFDRVEAAEAKELGWREWNWSVDPGETITVNADTYTLPITFSSSQLGVR